MANELDRERVRARLEALGRRIADERRKLAQFDTLDYGLDQEWDRLVKEHATICNRLEAHPHEHVPDIFHVDVSRLERDFERWGKALEELITGRAQPPR